MNDEDRRIRADERDASPERFPSSSVADPRPPALERTLTREEKAERRETLARTVTASTSSSSSSGSSNATIEREEMRMSRVPTQRDNVDLERHPTALSRIQTARSQHTLTVGTSLRSRTADRHSKLPLPNFGDSKPYPAPLPDRDEYVVGFDGPNDPLHAQNWPLKKKMPVAITLGFVTLTAAFGSSIFSAALGSVAQQYNLSREVSILGVSLYVLGFATG